MQGHTETVEKKLLHGIPTPGEFDVYFSRIAGQMMAAYELDSPVQITIEPNWALLFANRLRPKPKPAAPSFWTWVARTVSVMAVYGAGALAPYMGAFMQELPHAGVIEGAVAFGMGSAAAFFVFLAFSPRKS